MPGRPRNFVLPASRRLGRFIARQRELVHLSQSDLAAAMGVSARTLSSLENGRRPIFDEHELAQLAHALQIDDDAFRTASVAEAEDFHEDLRPRSRQRLRPLLEELVRELRAEADGQRSEMLAVLDAVAEFAIAQTDAAEFGDPPPIRPELMEKLVRALDASAPAAVTPPDSERAQVVPQRDPFGPISGEEDRRPNSRRSGAAGR